MLGQKGIYLSNRYESMPADTEESGPDFTRLIETAKANGREPYAWLRHILERLPAARNVEDYEALLPWNCSPHPSA